jgi:hypothetical protein
MSHCLFGLCVAKVAILGCRRSELPLPHSIDHRVVTPVTICIDDQELGETPIPIKSGREIAFAATLKVAHEQYEAGLDFGILHVQWMPSGTSSSDWEKARNQNSLALAGMIGIAPEVRMKKRATLAPGGFEVRIYAVFRSARNPELRQTLLRTGRVLIVP